MKQELGIRHDGAAGSAEQIRRPVRSPPFPALARRRLHVLQHAIERHLQLTPEQVERLKPVFGVTRQMEMNQQVMPALIPEQQAKLRKLLEE